MASTLGLLNPPRIIAVAIVIASATTANAADMPTNPAVTQDTIASTICVPHWTATIRPPVEVTNAVKRRQFEAFGLPPELMGDFRLDHIIPLSLGGSAADEKNLQLQDSQDSEHKDAVERCLSRAVCDGRLSLAEAQRLIWSNWKTAGRACAAGR